MPCAVNALLNDEGIPVVCETDIHGAITSLMVEAAGMGESRSFFADWTIRHPDNPNGELLQHCGPWPISIAKEKAKHGDVSLVRFDGDNGEYSLLLENAKGIDGPKGMETYLWVEVENIKRLEAKIVEKNQPLLAYIRESLPEAEESMISHMALKEMSKNVKFAIRTGEFTPYPNIILTAGVAFPA